MAREPVLRELDDAGVLLLTLNRPEKKNAFDDPQWDGLRDALNEAREDPAVAVALVTGAGGDFSAGQDLGAFGAAQTPRDDGYPTGYGGCMDAVFGFDKPLLAAARGVGVGIGCTLLFACDVVYVGESVRLRLPFAALGLAPEGGSSHTLPAAIGAQRAAELLFTAEWIDSARALEVGIAARALPDAELLGAALAKAREIARWPVPSLRAIKRCLMAARAPGVEAARKVEDACMAELAGSPENVEAIRAFLERRPPDFARFRAPR